MSAIARFPNSRSMSLKIAPAFVEEPAIACRPTPRLSGRRRAGPLQPVVMRCAASGNGAARHREAREERDSRRQHSETRLRHPDQAPLRSSRLGTVRRTCHGLHRGSRMRGASCLALLRRGPYVLSSYALLSWRSARRALMMRIDSSRSACAATSRRPRLETPSSKNRCSPIE